MFCMNVCIWKKNCALADDSKHCLELFQRNLREFVRRAMDETWVPHYHRPVNCLAIEPGASRSTQPSSNWPKIARKNVGQYFLVPMEYFFINCLGKAKTATTNQYYMLLNQLNDEIKIQRLHTNKKSALQPRSFGGLKIEHRSPRAICETPKQREN